MKYKAIIEEIMSAYSRDQIANMDETGWKLVNHGFVTLGDLGGETVNGIFDGDSKVCLTAIAVIDAAKGRLPLWIACRRKTARCEKRYREAEMLGKAIREGDLMVSHKGNGWTSAQLASEYLRRLNRCYRGKSIGLLLDVFDSRRGGEAKEFAAQLNIRLEFVPAGLTGEH